MQRISRIKQYLTILIYELLRNIRRKRSYVMFIILALIIALPIVVRAAFNLPIQNNPVEFISSNLNFVDLLIILSATFFAGDILVSEYEKKTGYTLFPNPVRKEIIYMGKFTAAIVSTLAVVLIYYLSAITITFYHFNTVPVATWSSLGYALLYVFAVIGLTFFFNVISRSTTMSTLLTFFTLFMILPIIQQIITFTGTEPWPILTYVSQVITLTFNPPNQRKVVLEFDSFKVYIFYPDFTIATYVMLAYAATTIALSLVLFKRRELKE